MITAGIDIGSTTIKIVIIKDNAIIGSGKTYAGTTPAQTAKNLYNKTLTDSDITENKIDAIATTGYGRRLVNFGDIVLTEIRACAIGAAFVLPEILVRTIIDVGGQDTKVISISEDGEIEGFSMNDKCAAGTGRFLEMLASRLDMTYEEFVTAALESFDTLLQMNSTCAVFAESEAIGMLAKGEKKGNIAAAAHHAIASRIASMVRRTAVAAENCLFTGGGALNRALVKALEEQLGNKILIPQDPQLIVAIGAALWAARKIQGNTNEN